MSSPEQNPAFESTEVGRIDSSLRSTGVVFSISSALWLVFASFTGFLAYLQLAVPSMLEKVPFLTYGFLKPVADTALTHGWVTNAAFALIVWIMSRLSERAPDFDIRRYLLVPAGVVYNFMLTFGILAIFRGEARPFFLLEIPSKVMLSCSMAFSLITVWTILDYCRRKRRTAYISQFYILGAVFWLAWTFSITHLILGKVPINGVIQAVTASWFAHAYLWCWMVPVGCAVAYYLLPKLTGQPIRNYKLAFVCFWLLAFIGIWGGPSALVGGPVPQWIQNYGVIGSLLLAVPALGIAMNLLVTQAYAKQQPLETSSGSLYSLCSSPSGRFMGIGLLFLPLFGILTSTSAHPDHKETFQFTFWQEGIFYLGVYGFFTMVALAGFYFMMPRLTGREWPCASTMKFHFVSVFVGLLIILLGLFWGGFAHADAMAKLDRDYTYISFITWAPVLFASSGFFLVAIGQIAFLIHLMSLIFAFPHSCFVGKEGPTFLAPEIDERSNA